MNYESISKDTTGTHQFLNEAKKKNDIIIYHYSYKRLHYSTNIGGKNNE